MEEEEEEDVVRLEDVIVEGKAVEDLFDVVEIVVLELAVAKSEDEIFWFFQEFEGSGVDFSSFI